MVANTLSYKVISGQVLSLKSIILGSYWRKYVCMGVTLHVVCSSAFDIKEIYCTVYCLYLEAKYIQLISC